MVISWIFCLMVLLFVVHCDSYNPFSPGPQPTTLEPTEHQDILNVFGLLRPDSLQGLSLSYVHLELSYPPSDSPDSTIVPDAKVQIKNFDGKTTIDSSVFIYSDFGVFPTREYRNLSFFPKIGTYQLICKKQGFPTLMGETTLPDVPDIKEGSLKQQNNRLTFHIIRDNNVGLYEVVLEGQEWLIRDRFLRPEAGNVLISLEIHGGCKGPCLLSIYAFDLNLSTYLSTNLSIKPNIYQADFSTVINGYGCFGSLNILKQTIELM